MIAQLTNASAVRVIVAMVVYGLVAWLGAAVTGEQVSASAYYGVCALVVVYAVIDHLHGIRGQLVILAALAVRDHADALNLIVDDPVTAQPGLAHSRQTGLS